MFSHRLRILASNPEVSRFRKAAKTVDLTAVFHSHGTSEHAQESVAEIEPDSIVYTEGYTVEPQSAQQFGHYIAQLIEYKRTLGKTSDYFRYRDSLIQGLDERLKRISLDDELHFIPNRITLLQGLLAKDCDIIPADYSHCDDFGDQQNDVDEYSKKMRLSLHDEVMKRLLAVGNDEDIPATITDVFGMIEEDYHRNELREDMAVVAVLNDLTMISDDKIWSENAPRTQAGKLRAYVTYGTAHRNSLSLKFSEWGVSPRIIELSRLHEFGYRPSNDDEFSKNASRLLAKYAFQAATHAVIEGYGYDSAISLHNEMVSTIEESTMPLEDSIRFAGRCLAVRVKSNIDIDTAMDAYEDVAMSFLSHPGTTN